jgi:hypothetical protein
VDGFSKGAPFQGAPFFFAFVKLREVHNEQERRKHICQEHDGRNVKAAVAKKRTRMTNSKEMLSLPSFSTL